MIQLQEDPFKSLKEVGLLSKTVSTIDGCIKMLSAIDGCIKTELPTEGGTDRCIVDRFTNRMVNKNSITNRGGNVRKDHTESIMKKERSPIRDNRITNRGV